MDVFSLMRRCSPGPSIQFGLERRYASIQLGLGRRHHLKIKQCTTTETGRQISTIHWIRQPRWLNSDLSSNSNAEFRNRKSSTIIETSIPTQRMPNENENHWTEHICKMLLVSTRTWAIAASTQLGLERRQKWEFKIHCLQDASKYGHRQNDINHQPSTHPSQHRRYIELSATALNTFLNPPPRVAFESIHRYYSCSGSQIYVTNQPVTSNQSSVWLTSH